MKSITKHKRVKMAWDDRIFSLLCNVLLVLFVITCFYPIYFIVIASFTNPTYVNSGDLLLYPKEISMLGYQMVFEDGRIWTGYYNTIIYTVGGTLLGTITAMMAGYALSRKDFLGRGIIMKILVFTMYFGGGIIPLFLVIRTMGLVNTRFLMIVLGSVSVYNTIVVRSFMMGNIPDELYEAAVIDGCGHGTFFAKVVVPLSKAVMVVIILWCAVGYWNSYFNAMIFLSDSEKYPLQLFLRDILLSASAFVGATAEEGIRDQELALQMRIRAQVIKYSVITVSTAPIMCVYPFLQKHFVKGVMIGSVKG